MKRQIPKTYQGKKLKVLVSRLHSENSQAITRRHPGRFYPKASPYVTSVIILDEDGKTIGKGISRCSPKDQPSKSLGYLIAAGRAAKSLADNHHQ